MDDYLKIIRKSYFVLYKTGFLKNNADYYWHYFVKNLIKKGAVVIDIGAHMGYYSSTFSDLAGKTGKVYSIEPAAPLLKQIRVQTNKKKKITILPFALGDENKRAGYS